MWRFDLSRSPRLWLFTCLVCVSACAGCEKSPPKDLERGARMIEMMLRPRYLRKSMFLAVYPDGRASEFVDFSFSTLGAAEWPPTDHPGMDPMERAQYRQARMPMAPAGVAFRAATPDPDAGRQIVLSYDDETNEVIVMGYEDPSAEPALERRVPMPQITLSAEERKILDAFAGGSLEMGASPRSEHPYPDRGGTGETSEP